MQANVREYYQQFEEQQTQSLIDQRVKEHLGQAFVGPYPVPFRPMGPPFGPPGMMRPPFPGQPWPGLPSLSLVELFILVRLSQYNCYLYW